MVVRMHNALWTPHDDPTLTTALPQHLNLPIAAILFQSTRPCPRHLQHNYAHRKLQPDVFIEVPAYAGQAVWVAEDAVPGAKKVTLGPDIFHPMVRG